MADVIPFPVLPKTEVSFLREPVEIVIFPVIPIVRPPVDLEAGEMRAALALMHMIEDAAPPKTRGMMDAALRLRREYGTWVKALAAVTSPREVLVVYPPNGDGSHRAELWHRDGVPGVG